MARTTVFFEGVLAVENRLRDDVGVLAVDLQAVLDHVRLDLALQDGAGPDEKTDAKVTVLKEYVEHHVKEEEKELFPKLRKTEMDLAEVGEELRARKEERKAEGADGGMQQLT